MREHLVCLFIVILFYSCNKTVDDKNSGKELNIEFSNGKVESFGYKGSYSMAFDFSHYKSYKSSPPYVYEFSIYTGALSTNYTLYFAKNDDNIIIGNNYTSSSPEISLLFSSDLIAPNDIITNATKTELQFTKFQNPGIIEGSFKAYLNNSLWCKGTFKFNSL